MNKIGYKQSDQKDHPNKTQNNNWDADIDHIFSNSSSANIHTPMSNIIMVIQAARSVVINPNIIGIINSRIRKNIIFHISNAPIELSRTVSMLVA